MDTTLDQLLSDKPTVRPDTVRRDTAPPSTSRLQTPTQPSRLENCDAVMVTLSPTRHVIVRREDAKRMIPTERICKRIRDLKAGDQVLYNGLRETVYRVSVF